MAIKKENFALEAQSSAIFDFMKIVSDKDETLSFEPLMNELDEIVFNDYILPQFKWAWRNWNETESESFLELSLFWVQQYVELIKTIEERSLKLR